MDRKAKYGVRDKEYLSALKEARQHYDRSGVFEIKSPFGRSSCNHHRWEPAPGHGNGFGEVLQLSNGLIMSVSSYELSRPMDVTSWKHEVAFRCCILLTGRCQVMSPNGGHMKTVRDGHIWFRVNEATGGELRSVTPAKERMTGVSVEIPRTTLEHWLGETTCELSRSLELMVKPLSATNGTKLHAEPPRPRTVADSHPLMQAAHSLFATERHTVYGLLQFESRALDFLSQTLMLEAPLQSRVAQNMPQRHKAVEEAMDILGSEWGAPPTIASLARRVGINECYLKTDFRVRTGLSIGEYVRKIRMEKALALLESGGCTVLQAAIFVGYTNPSHFSHAFKQFHGYLPSACIGRS